MWRKKTNSEILHANRAGRRRKNLWLALTWAAVFGLVVTSPLVKGWRLGGLTLTAPPAMPAAVRKTVMAGLALGIGVRVWRRGTIKDCTKICQKCNRVEIDDGRKRCDCGGTFFVLSEMKWEDIQFPSARRPASGDGRAGPQSKVNVIELAPSGWAGARVHQPLVSIFDT